MVTGHETPESIKFMTLANQCIKARHGGVAGIVRTHRTEVVMVTYGEGSDRIKVVRNIGNLYDKNKDWMN